jgi:hypothetical protein
MLNWLMSEILKRSNSNISGSDKVLRGMNQIYWVHMLVLEITENSGPCICTLIYLATVH